MLPPPLPPPKEPVKTAWPWVMQLGLAFLLGAFTLLLIQHAWQRAIVPGRPATVMEPAIYLIDLNQATRGELMQLPGVGPALAERIDQYRQTRHAFRSVDELEDVPGIGPTLLERLRPRLKVTPDSSLADSKSSETAPSPPAAGRKLPPAKPIDLNLATRDELMRLPGIGPALAERIIADRTERGPYKEVSDVTRVKGIKTKLLEKIRPHAKVSVATPEIAQQ